jgi:hypothetical protein
MDFIGTKVIKLTEYLSTSIRVSDEYIKKMLAEVDIFILGFPAHAV